MIKLPCHSNKAAYHPELDRPVETVIKTHAFGNQQDDEFVLCIGHGQDENVVNYNNQIQNIALWLIETADGVSLDDTSSGGSWTVLYLYRKSFGSTKISYKKNDNDTRKKIQRTHSLAILHSSHTMLHFESHNQVGYVVYAKH